MSTRIRPTNPKLPALSLPDGALSLDDERYEIHSETDRSAIEPLEHKLRMCFIKAGPPTSAAALLEKYSHYNAEPGDADPWAARDAQEGKPLALRYAEGALRHQWSDEERFYENFESDEVLNGAPQYLADQLRNCRNANDPKAAVEEVHQSRTNWYRLLPWKNLYTVFKQQTLGKLIEPLMESSTLRPTNRSDPPVSYAGVIVIPEGGDTAQAAREYGVPPPYVRTEDEFRTHHSSDTEMPVPSDYGIELPAPLLLGDYLGGSEYLLIPWSSGLVCQGPFKQQYPHRITCKHEVAAAFRLSQSDDIFLPVDEGVDVPARARRFVDPGIALNFTPAV